MTEDHTQDPDTPQQCTSSLAVPFVACTSQGGPYDDTPFAAGFDCGALRTELAFCASVGAVPGPRYVKRPLVAQLDLIAMDHGYLMTVTDDDPQQSDPEWQWAVFTLGQTCTHVQAE